MNTLMALYNKRSEIPPRPSSPIDPYSGDAVKIQEFGQPSEQTQQRIQALQPQSTSSLPGRPQSLADIQAILSGLIPPPAPQTISNTLVQPIIPQPPQQAPQPAQNTASNWLEQIFAQHSVPAAVPNQQPVQPTPSYTYNAQPTPAISTPPPNPLLAALQGMAPPPPQGLPFNSAPTANSNIQVDALLAALSAHPQPPTQQLQEYAPPPPIPAPIGPDAAAILAQLGLTAPNYTQYGLPQQAQQLTTVPQADSYYSGAYEHPDRKRTREFNDEDGRDDGYKRQNFNSTNARGGGYGNKWVDRKPKQWNKDDPPKKFVLPCKFWPEGKCRKGADCTYIHE